MRLFLFAQTLNERKKIGGEKTYGNGQQDDAEEFSQNVDERLAHMLLHPSGTCNDDIDEDHVERERCQDVDLRKFGLQRNQRRESAGSCNQREDNGNQSGLLGGTSIFENLYIEQHLKCHDEDDQRTCHGKRLDVDMEELQGCA